MLVKLGKCKWAKHFQIFTFNRYELFRTSIILNSKENYYEILGIHKSCSQTEIKSAYFALAKKYHPDINSEKYSKEKFKLINEQSLQEIHCCIFRAYETLGNDKKRARYDGFQNPIYSASSPNTYGFTHQNNFHSTKKSQYFYENDSEAKSKFYDKEYDFWKDYDNPDSGFDKNFYKKETFSQFNDFFRFQRPEKLKGDPLKVNIEITKKQIEENEAITLTLNKYINCSSCNGHKTESGHPPRRCYECGGSGLDSYIMDRPCTSCSGKGVILKFPCKECGGKGIRMESVEDSLRIPRDVKDGDSLIRSYAGHAAGSYEGMPGDMIIQFIVINE